MSRIEKAAWGTAAGAVLVFAMMPLIFVTMIVVTWSFDDVFFVAKSTDFWLVILRLSLVTGGAAGVLTYIFSDKLE